MIFFGNRLRDRTKIQVMFFVAAILVLLLSFGAKFGGTSIEKFWICFGILFIFGPVGGMIQGSVFGLASLFPFKYVGAIMLGNGLNGITCTVIKLIFVLIPPIEENLYYQSIIFFTFGVSILLLCSASYSVINNLEFYQFHKNYNEPKPKISVAKSSMEKSYL